MKNRRETLMADFKFSLPAPILVSGPCLNRNPRFVPPRGPLYIGPMTPPITDGRSSTALMDRMRYGIKQQLITRSSPCVIAIAVDSAIPL